MRILLDTNLLVRTAEPRNPARETALAAIQNLERSGFEPCIVPQVLYEYWVVCTRPSIQNGLGLTTVQASNDLERLQQLFVVLHDEPALFNLWSTIVKSHDVSGKNAHDARLVAAMMLHQVTHLLTFNDADFTRFTSITVMTPVQLAQVV